MAELSTVARPYAEALFAVAKAGDLAAIHQELTGLSALASHDDVVALAKNPAVSKDHMLAVLSGGTSTKSGLSDVTTNFLSAVVANGRTALLPEIAKQFTQLKNSAASSADAHIVSAFELSAEQLRDLTTALQGKFGLQLKPTVTVDASLICGVRVQVGDQVLDSSVQAQLERMRVALMA